MIKLRRAIDCGSTDLTWLRSDHVFSFGEYKNSAWDGFSSLRVLNDHFVFPKESFPSITHRNCEIVHYVMQGALETITSTGKRSILKAGHASLISAKEGIQIRLRNASLTHHVRFLELWFLPNALGGDPSYTHGAFGDTSCVVSPGGKEGSLSMAQDASLYALSVKEGESLSLPSGEFVWLYLMHGEVSVAGYTLTAKDSLAMKAEPSHSVEASKDSQLLRVVMA